MKVLHPPLLVTVAGDPRQVHLEEWQVCIGRLLGDEAGDEGDHDHPATFPELKQHVVGEVPRDLGGGVGALGARNPTGGLDRAMASRFPGDDRQHERRDQDGRGFGLRLPELAAHSLGP